VASSADRYTAYDPNAPLEEGPGVVGYVAVVLAWAVPGLGHMLIGQKARGLVFMVGIHGLFALGLLLAGIRAINPPEQAIWTYTQYLTGWPMIVADKVEKKSRVELGDRAAPAGSPQYKGTLGELFDQQVPPANPESKEDQEKRAALARAFIQAHPSFAVDPKVLDLGAVYCGIAGMLNLLVMFDVLLRITGSTREEAGKTRKPAENPTAEGGAAGGAA
jgi:hypothetical protein